MASPFPPEVIAVEAKVTELLTAAGWTKRRMGQAASGCFSIAKFGNIEGNFIGLWADWKLDGAVAQWSVSEEPEAIVERIVTQVAALTYPEIAFVTNQGGEQNEAHDVPPEGVLEQVPFEDGPGYVLPYLAHIEGRYYILGNLEVMYASEGGGGSTDYPAEPKVTSVCEAAIEVMRQNSNPGVIVFPLNHDELPDRCVISVAIPVREDSRERVKARLAEAFCGYETIDLLYAEKGRK